jgi:arylsulfatase A-like enzyme
VAAAITGLYPRALNIEEPTGGRNDRLLHDSFRTIAEVFQAEGYYTIGITANPNTNKVFNFDQGYDYYEDTGDVLWRTGYALRKRTAEEVNASLLQQLRGPARGRPFFAHLVYVDVHRPWLDDVVAGRFPELAESVRGMDTASYDMQIRYVDAALGDLLKELDALGRQDTLVVVSSDHGEGFGRLHRGDVEHGEYLYNTSIWVPLILYHPSLETLAHRQAERVELVSVMPTLLDLLGIRYKPPCGGGKSFKSLIHGEPAAEPRDSSVVETEYKTANRSAILSLGWKLITTYTPAVGKSGEHVPLTQELYRYEEDRDEASEVSADNPALVEELFGRLTAWQQAHPPLVPDDELKVDVGSRTLEHLKDLGYIDDSD